MFHRNFQQEKKKEKRRKELAKMGLNHKWAGEKDKTSGPSAPNICGGARPTATLRDCQAFTRKMFGSKC
jgi:hypothetical protein